MKAVSTGTEDDGRDEDSGSWRDRENGDRLEKILEQNERIIELLEDIADSGDSNPFGDSSAW